MTGRSLILVKHSLPEVLEDVPAREWNLSEEGRWRAQKLAAQLVRLRPEVIVSSSESKARQTAEIIAGTLGLEFHEVDGLHEHDRSQSPYYSKDEFQNLIQEFFAKPSQLVFGNETADQALVRFRQAVDSVMNSHDGRVILIVAHGTVISLFVSWLSGCDGYLLWKELGLPSFVVLDIQFKILLQTENLSGGESYGIH
jgi:broad specificity phosphatase PhoE